jgi:hypothetical protein
MHQSRDRGCDWHRWAKSPWSECLRTNSLTMLVAAATRSGGARHLQQRHKPVPILGRQGARLKSERPAIGVDHGVEDGVHDLAASARAGAAYFVWRQQRRENLPFGIGQVTSMRRMTPAMIMTDDGQKRQIRFSYRRPARPHDRMSRIESGPNPVSAREPYARGAKTDA